MENKKTSNIALVEDSLILTFDKVFSLTGTAKNIKVLKQLATEICKLEAKNLFQERNNALGKCKFLIDDNIKALTIKQFKDFIKELCRMKIKTWESEKQNNPYLMPQQNNHQLQPSQQQNNNYQNQLLLPKKNQINNQIHQL